MRHEAHLEVPLTLVFEWCEHIWHVTQSLFEWQVIHMIQSVTPVTHQPATALLMSASHLHHQHSGIGGLAKPS